MKAILNGLGFEKNSKYVRDYFFTTNMRASIYMSLVVIVLEVWMIIRMTVTIFRDNLQSNMMHYIEKYYVNYFILTFTGIIMLILAVRFMRGKKDNRYLCTVVKWVFTLVCIYFGIKISLNDYSKGEQILTFLTMELFSLCLLTWKPYIAFVLASASYVYFYYRMNEMVAVNTGEVGTTVATQINFFIMWISTMMVCIANYNNTRMQALKDENLEKVNTYLSKISIEDELTGIHNMVYFRNEAEKVLSYVTTDRENAVFLFFDIENFKSYNEKYGFHEGNELLIKVAHMIEDSFKGSLVSRFSDDHFVVLTRIDGAKNIIGHLSGEIKKLQREVHLELKCGAYKPVGDEADVSLACDRARFACNSIKGRHDVNCCVYDEMLRDKMRRQQYVVDHIDEAIEKDYIQVFYQPVIRVATGDICGYEALVRWVDPQYGTLRPADFVETLEQFHLIHMLDQHVIKRVCMDYKELADAGEPLVPISINISRLDFELCHIFGIVEQTCNEYGVPREMLDLEITESALNENVEYIKSECNRMISLGYHIWLDDFGSGYSSLNTMVEYKFDVLKLDLIFLRNLEKYPKTSTLMTFIVEGAKGLGLSPLCEGVETKEQYEFLKKIGCERAQGFYFGKAMPMKETRAFTAEKGMKWESV